MGRAGQAGGLAAEKGLGRYGAWKPRLQEKDLERRSPLGEGVRTVERPWWLWPSRTLVVTIAHPPKEWVVFGW